MAMAQGFSREDVKNIIADIDGSALIDDKTKTLLHFSKKITKESFKQPESQL